MRVAIRFLISLLLVGALVGCSTQKIESPGPSQPTKQLYVGLHTTDWEVRVKIEPLQPGDRSATLKLIAHSGEIPVGTLLALELSKPEGAGAPQRFEAKPLGNGEFKVDAIPLTAGKWQLRVIVSAPGTEPQSSGYTFEVPA
ncbi:MAG TPA: FixH family protein [Symbiobacteriaceae bacterium]|nr:FixH family protein [Symbiobacteriaceae bacterium]